MLTYVRMYVHVNNYNNGFTKTITICIDFDCIQLLKDNSNKNSNNFKCSTTTICNNNSYILDCLLYSYVCMNVCACSVINVNNVINVFF